MSEVIPDFTFYGILKAFSAAMDLISKRVVGHHKQVAYIALMIGRELGLPDSRLRNLIIAALLHDLGVFYLDQNFDDITFDNKDNKHAEVGYHLVKEYFNTDYIPEIIRFHHLEWEETSSIRVPEESHLLFLADRITTLIQERNYILSQIDEIEDRITKFSGIRF
jgi:putative nucleotidyltransferase with HDIG domain